MPRIRVPLIGAGTPADPFRASLPTYNLIDINYARGVALVEIPDDDLPDDDALKAQLGGVSDIAAADRAPLTPAARRAWHDHLDARYREHAGRFRPDRK